MGGLVNSELGREATVGRFLFFLTQVVHILKYCIEGQEASSYTTND
jgi:hypothetical protein